MNAAPFFTANPAHPSNSTRGFAPGARLSVIHFVGVPLLLKLTPLPSG